MNNIYKPLFLGISLALALSSNAANAKQSLVKNVVKNSSHKHSTSQKSVKNAAKHISSKNHASTLAQDHVSKTSPGKAQRTSSTYSKSATKQALAKHKVITQLNKRRSALMASATENQEDTSDNTETQSLTNSSFVSANIPPQNNFTTELNNGVTVYNDDHSKLGSNQFNQLSDFKKHRTTLYKIKGGDTLASIFKDLNLNNNVVRNRKISRQFKSLIPGKILSISTNARGELTSLAYKNISINNLLNASSDRVESADNRFNNIEPFSSETSIARPVGQVKHVSAHVVVQSTLENAGRNAGLPKKITKQLTDIFAWDIDFSQNLRPNDQFTIVYEKIFEHGRAIDTGDIVAAEFINQGESHRAVRYRDNNGNMNYYTPDGEGMRRAFLRNPVDYARVSSVFNTSRRHPILNRIRAHKGVDYAASTGTPIKSTGDGRIVFKGRKGGYGQVVMIQHGNQYTTLYAHLSHFNETLNEGTEVRQGQVIGYVGQTGLATGPHLHYEFLVEGVHKDPLNVKLPHSLPINKSLLTYFKTQTRPLLAQLEIAKTTMLAKNTEQDIQQE